MSDGVEFQEMIFAAVTGDFELGAEPDGGARLFGPSNGFLDVVEVAVEIHSPLIQVASGHLQQPHLPISDSRFFFPIDVPGNEEPRIDANPNLQTIEKWTKTGVGLLAQFGFGLQGLEPRTARV